MLLLGYYVDLDLDAIALHGPKLVGAFNLVRLPVFDSGNMTVDIHSLRELRGCVNRWLATGRIWKWLVAPANGLLGFSDNALIWVRCADIHRRYPFWGVAQFRRGMTREPGFWWPLFLACSRNWSDYREN